MLRQGRRDTDTEGIRSGADGILVCGCHPGDCHYLRGNLSARRRVTAWIPFLDAVVIGKERLRLEWSSAPEGPKIAETVRNSTRTIKGLVPSPFNRRQNEH